MVKQAAAKKQKPTKKPLNATKKKITKPKPKKTITQKSIITNTSSDSDNDDTSPEQIQKLIEPYTKDQLIEFIINAAVANPTLYTRIRDAADSDVSHRKIFVYGLGWDTTKETLTLAFKPYGEIEDCNVVIDRATGKAKGFGFVQFRSRKGAIKALKEPRKKINNRTASCQLASLGTAAAGSFDNSNRKVYVSNVNPDTDPDRLRSFFAKFGEIETGPLGFDSSTGKSRGYALFVYKNEEGFKKALEERYKVFEGQQLQCQKAASVGKNKGVSAPVTVNTVTAPVVQQPTPQMLAAAAANQNFGLYNAMYGGLGFLAANPLYASGGFGGYYAGVPNGLSGAVPPVLPGLGVQNVNAYTKTVGSGSGSGSGLGSGSGSGSGSRSQSGGGSLGGYPSHI